ncbi:MAG: hypothetical protein ABIP53_01785 [Candidatus Limnocylindrales bacterium]
MDLRVTVGPMGDWLRSAVFAHGGGDGGMQLPDHEGLMFLMPTLPIMFVGTVIIAKALDRRGFLGTTRTVDLTTALVAIAAGLSLGAAAIHFAVVEQHLADDLALGLFFIGLGLFQAIWSLMYVLRHNRPVAWVAIAVNAAVIGIWLVSRTVGLPFGPDAWQREAVGGLDLVSTVFELLLVGVLLPTVLPRRFPNVAARRFHYEQAFVLGFFSVVTIALVATVVLIGTTAPTWADAARQVEYK